MGLSPHNTIGVGDAENDHTLLDACEVGVAVANAVEAIRAHADLTLRLPDGAGVAELLRGRLLTGRTHIYSRRRQITLGTDERGAHSPGAVVEHARVALIAVLQARRLN